MLTPRDVGEQHGAHELAIIDDEDQEQLAPGAKRRRNSRTRMSFTWRQVSVLEQVFEIDPLPRQVSKFWTNRGLTNESP